MGPVSPTFTFLYADFPSAFLFRVPPQIALSVEIGDLISLCWGPTSIEKLVTSVFSFSQLLPIYH
ncbi:probable membrane protein [Staphylococcus aureus RF122]|nr:probable membrane protein [Staphylococcus aureus RF122]